MTTVSPALPHHLPAPLEHELEDLYLRGTPANTLRAYERDLVYIRAWKQARFGVALAWPGAEEVALRFVLDHARDLAEAALDDPARTTAEALIAARLRRALNPPLCPLDARSADRFLARVSSDAEPNFALRCTACAPGPRQGAPGAGLVGRKEVSQSGDARRA
ncbi:MAG: hypothetical protein AAFW01_00445 [Pseudomonadota bacterium]